ncbi:hypothetical protein BGZ57DRAFT_771967, partial [Hyaloscypha finlandica]
IENSEDTKLYKRILAILLIIYRPLTLYELESLVNIYNSVSNEFEALLEIIGLCSSFLILREYTISFIY